MAWQLNSRPKQNTDFALALIQLFFAKWNEYSVLEPRMKLLFDTFFSLRLVFLLPNSIVVYVAVASSVHIVKTKGNNEVYLTTLNIFSTPFFKRLQIVRLVQSSN